MQHHGLCLEMQEERDREICFVLSLINKFINSTHFDFPYLNWFIYDFTHYVI